MDENTRLLARSDLIVREEGDEGEALVFDPQTEKIKVLNHTGLLLWGWCDGTHTAPELVTMLSERFGSMAPEILKDDVYRFVQELLNMEFLESIEPA